MYLLQQCRAKTKQRAHGIFVEVYVVFILEVDMRLIATADAVKILTERIGTRVIDK